MLALARSARSMHVHCRAFNCVRTGGRSLLERLKSKPKDFTFDEARVLLGMFGFQQIDKGKTSGSRVMFKSEEFGTILLHKPHPSNELKSYQVKQLLEKLKEEGLV